MWASGWAAGGRPTTGDGSGVGPEEGSGPNGGAAGLEMQLALGGNFVQTLVICYMLKLMGAGLGVALAEGKVDRWRGPGEFLEILWPVIFVDETLLKNRHGGTLFLASMLDSNNNIFVLAFGIADSENDNSWLWFFSKLRDTYGEPEGLAIVSDRHKSIDNAVHIVYPNAFHGACMFHLLNNLKSKYGSHGEELQMKFLIAAKAYTKTECEQYMRGLDRLDRRIRPYLEKAKFETWTRSYSPTKRYTMMISNIAESLNATLKAARNLPIDILVECLRSLVQKWVWNNSNNANGTFTKISTTTENELRHDIVSKMKFQEDEMPYGHAVVVIAKRNLSVYDYCAMFYRTETLKALYQENVHPLPHKDEWNLPQHLDIMVLPPKTTIPAGRPRKKRIRSRGEPKVIITCGKCGQPGHNRKTCRNPPIEKPNKQKKPKTQIHILQQNKPLIALFIERVTFIFIKYYSVFLIKLFQI
ncbi:uncharacterized protein LOC133780212 [Humulus lupulus]|uniref:uncharacterized protein LOC133780212 n=1 Tax=Humulus lupulus TaxID=3486 RepID=UPI002B4149BE|nr:uncharacterized protein LOC133780212 [Humulus lupulus]